MGIDNYVIYNDEGKIIRSGYCSQRCTHLQAKENQKLLKVDKLEEDMDIKYKVKDKKLKEK